MKDKKIRCISVNDDIWEIAKELAKSDNRSISNLLSNLILKEKTKNK